jgi:hypothetical protein
MPVKDLNICSIEHVGIEYHVAESLYSIDNFDHRNINVVYVRSGRSLVQKIYSMRFLWLPNVNALSVRILSRGNLGLP